MIKVVKLVVLLMVFFSNLMADYIEEKRWDSGETLLTFFEKNKIPLKTYYNLDKEDQTNTEDIMQGVKYYVLKTDNNEIRQILIPITQELQIHIDRQENKSFKLSVIPISYQKLDNTLYVDITTSPYQDIVNATNDYVLANEFLSAYKKSIDFKRSIRKGDKIAVVYEENIRLGQSFGTPVIKAAMVETAKVANYIFLDKDGTYYDDNGKAIESFLLTRPLKDFKRISSAFTLKRWHPILKKYRAHHGIDYAASVGTPVFSAGNGRVVSARYRGGYGKTIEIKHEDGYISLYAHLHNFAGAIRVGAYVKKGQFIARVGNTGLSTGPHLHFGLYKNKRPINPALAIRVAKKMLKGEDKKEFLNDIKVYQDKIATILKGNKNYKHIDNNIEVYVTNIDENFKKIQREKNM